jgi:hypothetical protein
MKYNYDAIANLTYFLSTYFIIREDLNRPSAPFAV